MPLKPLLKWMGSKYSFRQEIIEKIHRTGYTGVYYEPFVGCGSVLLGLLPERAVINDLNGQIVNMWRQLKSDANELVDAYKSVDRSLITSEYYYERRAEHNEYRANKVMSPRSAAIFIWVTSHSFNGLYRTRNDGTFNANWNKRDHYATPDFDNWRNVGKYLNDNDISIFNTDFEDVVSLAEPGDLIYADPPYATGTGERAYSKEVYGGFDVVNDSIRVAETLEKCPCEVVCSNNDNDTVRRLYPARNWEYKQVLVYRAFHGSRGNVDHSKRSELVMVKRLCECG